MSDLLSRIPVPYEPMKKNRYLLTLPKVFGEVEYWVKNLYGDSWSWEPIDVTQQMDFKLDNPVGNVEIPQDILFKIVSVLHEGEGSSEILELGTGFEIIISSLDPTGVTVGELKATVKITAFNFDMDDNIRITFEPLEVNN